MKTPKRNAAQLELVGYMDGRDPSKSVPKIRKRLSRGPVAKYGVELVPKTIRIPQDVADLVRDHPDSARKALMRWHKDFGRKRGGA